MGIGKLRGVVSLGLSSERQAGVKAGSTVRPSCRPPANTFPRLLLDHAQQQPDAPAVREKDLGIWQTWSWAAVARRGARDRLRPGEPGLQARRQPRDRRRQPAAPVHGGARGAEPARRAGAALPGRGGRRDGLHAGQRRDRVRDRRRPGAGRQAAGMPRARQQPRRIRHIVYDDPRGLRHYDQPGLHRATSSCANWAAPATRRTPASSTQSVASGRARRRRP